MKVLLRMKKKTLIKINHEYSGSPKLSVMLIIFTIKN